MLTSLTLTVMIPPALAHAALVLLLGFASFMALAAVAASVVARVDDRQ